jgi:hypothetical protein
MQCDQINRLGKFGQALPKRRVAGFFVDGKIAGKI